MPQGSPIVGRGIVLSALVLACPAFAVNDIFVSTTLDVVDGADGVTSLREAFDLANADADDSVIHLEAGALYALTACQAGMLEDANVFGDLDHTDSESLTVLGMGSQIHNTCPGERVLESHHDEAGLLLHALTLTGGDSTDFDEPGGAVRSSGDVLVTDSLLSENHAERVAGIYAADKMTGQGAAVRIERSAIVDNDGTAVHAGDFNGSIEVYDSDISGNAGTALTLSFGPITVERSALVDNNGSGIGAVDGTPVRVADATIVGNGGNGIATTGQGYTVLTVERTLVEDNGSAGVLCSFCRDVLVLDTTIRGHHPTFGLGGGLRIVTGNVGEVGMADPHDLRVERSLIEDNSAPQGGGGIGVLFGGDPGGVRPLLVIRHSTVRWNSTGTDGAGAGVHLDEGDLVIVSSAVSLNRAGEVGDTGARGGGVFFTGDALHIERATVAENVAHGWAGGVFARAEDVLVERSILAFNEATALHGGGLYAERGEVILLESQVWKNEAAGSGGGVAFVDGPPPGEMIDEEELSDDARLDVTRSTLHRNHAAETGGGAFLDVPGGLHVLENSTVHANRADVSGGGVGGEEVVLGALFSTVTGNRAPLGANVQVVDGLLSSYAIVVAEGVDGDDCDVSGSIVAATYSVSGDASCGLAGAGSDNQESIGDPLLGTLTDNGGPTPTRLPQPTSPLVNVVPSSECLDEDQRLVARPQGPACDVGSVERRKKEPKHLR